jgi:hypothetical protein
LHRNRSAQLFLLAQRQCLLSLPLKEQLRPVAQARLQTVDIAGPATDRSPPQRVAARLEVAVIATAQGEVPERRLEHDELVPCAAQIDRLPQWRHGSRQLALGRQRRAKIDERGRQATLGRFVGALPVPADQLSMESSRFRRVPRVRDQTGHLPRHLRVDGRIDRPHYSTGFGCLE